MKPGSILISFVYANQEPDIVKLLQDKKITCFAMELIPRISRAQAMDALSSQAAFGRLLFGAARCYQAGSYPPMMTTAVGSLRPATVLVLGLGVAGLQALATRAPPRALLEGYDVRPETKEEAGIARSKIRRYRRERPGTGWGTARELTQEEKDKAAQVLTRHIQKADLIITTASIPGRPAPKANQQSAGRRDEGRCRDRGPCLGGRWQLRVYATRRDDRNRSGNNSRAVECAFLPREHASELYARNVCNLLKLMIQDHVLKIDWEDEILAKSVLTHAGEIKNEAARKSLGQVEPESSGLADTNTPALQEPLEPVHSN